MCLAIPAKLIELKGDQGVVDLHATRLPVNTLLIPEAKVGDWLLVHAGFAIQRIDSRAAAQTWAALRDLAEAAEESPPAGAADRPDAAPRATGETP